MDCNINHIPLEEHLKAMLRKSGGLAGLPIVEVSGHISKIPCDKNHLKFEDLLAASIGVDGCGKPALRVKIINSCTPYLDCKNNSESNWMQLPFAYDYNDKTFALVLNRTPV